MVLTRQSYRMNNNVIRSIKVRKHKSYGYSAIPTRIGKNAKHIDNNQSSPIIDKYKRIFPDGHLGIMDIKENNPLQASEYKNKIEWLVRISKYHPTLEIKISGDNNDFFPSFQLKAVRVFKEYSDDTMGCVQLFNNDKPLSVTFYHPDQLLITVI